MSKMDFDRRLPPEYLADLRLRKASDLADLAAARAARPPGPITPTSDEQTVSTATTPAADNHPGTVLRIVRPADLPALEPLPCVFWIQGGGFVFPDPEMDEGWCRGVASAHDCMVVSVGWRRAPEHIYPAAIDDCYDGLRWVVENSTQIGVDPDRIVIAGGSAGGGLAASLAILIRDRRELSVRHQMLVYPMLDDRSSYPSMHMVTDARLWTREKNDWAWRYYLGDLYGSPSVPAYAAATRAEDLTDLPPASILTGELDVFRDENLDYATKLFAAGIPTELHVYPGAPHGFDRMAPDSETTRRFIADRDAILRSAFS
jgi:acetyl esterase/lipase